MNTNSYIAPVWQLPVHGAERTGNGAIPKYAKYHCFVSDMSLCNKYSQATYFYDDGVSIESVTVLERPDCVCNKCLVKWKKLYQVDG